MKVWLVCPKCLDAFEDIPGAKCIICRCRSIVAPLMKQPEYLEIWEEDELDLELVGSHKNTNFRCSVYEYCDGELHFAADKDDELLYAIECNC